MNIFAAVIPADHSDLDSYESALEKAIPVTVPFANMDHKRIIWRNDFMLAASFSIHAPHVPIKNYVSSSGREFCTFNGVPIFDHKNKGDNSWADDLLHSYMQGSLDLDRLGGYYNMLLVNRDYVLVCNCLSRVEPIYWAKNENCIAFGNRASLVYALANRTTNFSYEPRALISLCTVSWLANNIVPFRGVELFPNGTMAIARPGHIEFVSYKPHTYAEYRSLDEDHANRLYDELSEELLNGLRVFGNFSDSLIINLTGGKDSRMLAAMCKSSGINFSCATAGGPEDRDVIVASEVAKILGVNHTSTPRQDFIEVPKIDLIERLHSHVTLSDGMLSIDDPIYPIHLKPGILLSGHAGECYRGGYEMVREGRRPPITCKEDALGFIRNLNLHNKNLFLKEEAVLEQERINEEIVEEFFDSSFPPGHFYDYMLTKFREGRGQCNARQGAAYGSFSFSPYLNDNALEIGWSFPLQYRKDEILFYNVLRRFCPPLANLRFSDSRWKFEAEEPGPNTSLEEWLAREPLPPSPALQGVHSWRLGYDGYMRNSVKEYLLDNPRSRLFEIVDYAKLEVLLHLPAPTASNILRSIYGTITAAYFLNDDWKPKPVHMPSS